MTEGAALIDGGARLAAMLPPGWIMMLGALVVPLLRGPVRQGWMLALPVLGLFQMLALPLGSEMSATFFAYELELLRFDSIARAFGLVFHSAAILSVVYAMKNDSALEGSAALVYSGSAISAVFAGDLITLFICWELTAVSSVFLIWASGNERANRSGMRYLIVQVGSGVLLLAGTIIHYAETGSLAFDHLGLVGFGTGLIFVAFGIKAAFPFLHNWLQDAYPNATVTGTVFLSAFTTKLAIYALARGFAGTEILIPIGAVMAVFPIFYAVIENDLRRVLAYGLNNQLGYMVVGVGIGTEFALNGTVAHVVAHVIYKGLLFMSMGAVLYRVGTVKASELGGLYKSMPITTLLCIVGAASISAPLTGGFVSKSMIVSAAAEEHYTVVFLVLLLASAGAFLYLGIKVCFFAFFGQDRGFRVKEAPLNMLIAMGGAAALCLGIGMFPGTLYGLLPYPVDYVPYTVSHVVTILQLLLFSVLAFAFLRKAGLYPPELRSTLLDSDWIYRRMLPWINDGLAFAYNRAVDRGLGPARGLLSQVMSTVERIHRPDGVLGNPWPTGATTLWAAIMLFALLLLSY
ncbi:MAG: Na(+)/H(+) antiporter subunit D [Myxococcota bacterium]|jgi:multicomponent Na+:H+ antiporter subunit D|nr:Na(+)/H(+) antiporter subunit D [Myxococcota bacterium]